MPIKKLPRQISYVREGDKLQFIRNTKVGPVWYKKGRIVYVLNVDSSVALLGMPKPLRDIDWTVRGDWTFPKDGFKFCRYIGTEVLLDSCKVVY